MNVKIELSFDEARSIRDGWAKDLSKLHQQTDELVKKIASIDAQLNGQLTLLVPPESPKAKKRKKGENFRTVETYLKSVGVIGATVADISKKTSLPVSSCNAVLKRHEDIFAKASDGLWRCKPNK